MSAGRSCMHGIVSEIRIVARSAESTCTFSRMATTSDAPSTHCHARSAVAVRCSTTVPNTSILAVGPWGVVRSVVRTGFQMERKLTLGIAASTEIHAPNAASPPTTTGNTQAIAAVAKLSWARPSTTSAIVAVGRLAANMRRRRRVSQLRPPAQQGSPRS